MVKYKGRGDVVKVRFANEQDIHSLVALEKEVWGEGAACFDALSARVKNFPKGTLIALDENKTPVGTVSFCLLDYQQYETNGNVSWYDLSGNGTSSTHNPEGRDLFGINLGVVAKAPKCTSTLLLVEVVKAGVRIGVRRGLLGSRLPGYHKVADKMLAEEYAWTTRKGLPIDPELRFYRKLGLRPIRLIENYFIDAESHDWGMIVEMKNPFYSSAPLRLIGRVLAAMPIDLARLIDRHT
jgi:hypothetical protein